MKFFANDYVLPDDQVAADHALAMMGVARKNVSSKLFNGNFADREMFGEFHREQLITLDILQLLQDGKIDLVHRENCYRKTEVLETEHGVVLVVPIQVRYEEFTAAIHKAFPDTQIHIADNEETE